MCGECCSTMGEIISIQKQIGDTVFRIGYSTTLEERGVTLDDDKVNLFFHTNPRSSLACPFLREQTPGRVICTVLNSRPELCQQYSCFRILILDIDNRRVGKVMERTRYFTTLNPRLHEIWQTECHLPDIIDEPRWEQEIERIFTRAGYRVVR